MVIPLGPLRVQPLDMVSASDLGETSVDQKGVLMADDLVDYWVVWLVVLLVQDSMSFASLRLLLYHITKKHHHRARVSHTSHTLSQQLNLNCTNKYYSIAHMISYSPYSTNTSQPICKHCQYNLKLLISHFLNTIVQAMNSSLLKTH